MFLAQDLELNLFLLSIFVFACFEVSCLTWFKKVFQLFNLYVAQTFNVLLDRVGVLTDDLSHGGEGMDASGAWIGKDHVGCPQWLLLLRDQIVEDQTYENQLNFVQSILRPYTMDDALLAFHEAGLLDTCRFEVQEHTHEALLYRWVFGQHISDVPLYVPLHLLEELLESICLVEMLVDPLKADDFLHDCLGPVLGHLVARIVKQLADSSHPEPLFLARNLQDHKQDRP